MDFFQEAPAAYEAFQRGDYEGAGKEAAKAVADLTMGIQAAKSYKAGTTKATETAKPAETKPAGPVREPGTTASGKSLAPQPKEGSAGERVAHPQLLEDIKKARAAKPAGAPPSILDKPAAKARTAKAAPAEKAPARSLSLEPESRGDILKEIGRLQEGPGGAEVEARIRQLRDQLGLPNPAAPETPAVGPPETSRGGFGGRRPAGPSGVAARPTFPAKGGFDFGPTPQPAPERGGFTNREIRRAGVLPPETGVADERTLAAREVVAKQIADKPYAQLTPDERTVADELVKEGHGSETAIDVRAQKPTGVHQAPGAPAGPVRPPGFEAKPTAPPEILEPQPQAQVGPPETAKAEPAKVEPKPKPVRKVTGRKTNAKKAAAKADEPAAPVVDPQADARAQLAALQAENARLKAGLNPPAEPTSTEPTPAAVSNVGPVPDVVTTQVADLVKTIAKQRGTGEAWKTIQVQPMDASLKSPVGKAITIPAEGFTPEALWSELSKLKGVGGIKLSDPEFQGRSGSIIRPLDLSAAPEAATAEAKPELDTISTGTRDVKLRKAFREYTQLNPAATPEQIGQYLKLVLPKSGYSQAAYTDYARNNMPATPPDIMQ